MKHLLRTVIGVALLPLSACTSIGVVENEPVGPAFDQDRAYSVENHRRRRPQGENAMFLAFSGGGTRAAAMAYGTLKELRDTRMPAVSGSQRLLDEVDRISSVSGGSFTSAYYGLFGDRIFDDFETVFLRKDVQGDLTSRVLDFGQLFSDRSRTELAIDYYDRNIFEGKTFADMQRADRPMILINATDLMAEAQFIFFQPQFDFLCSDLSSFKVARAVTASSAVPLVFDPVLIENYRDCGFEAPPWLVESRARAEREGDLRLAEVVRGFERYLDPDSPRYAALVDGGITDNLGLRTLTRVTSLIGDRKAYFEKTHQQTQRPRRFVVIAVNASTSVETGIGETRELPGISATLGALTDIQLHLYNTETNELVKEQLNEWAAELSTPEHPIKPYFIEIDISGVRDPAQREAFNQTPTSFDLTDEQVDLMIELGGRLLREHPVYQELLRDLGATK